MPDGSVLVLFHGSGRCSLSSGKIIGKVVDSSFDLDRTFRNSHRPIRLFAMHLKVAHSAWSNNGFLSLTNDKPLLGIGSLDFAGSGVVHLTGEQ